MSTQAARVAASFSVRGFGSGDAGDGDLVVDSAGDWRGERVNGLGMRSREKKEGRRRVWRDGGKVDDGIDG